MGKWMRGGNWGKRIGGGDCGKRDEGKEMKRPVGN